MYVETEQQMEQALIKRLQKDDYELVNVRNEKALLSNLKIQIEKHNDINLGDEQFEDILGYLSAGTNFEKAEKLRKVYEVKYSDDTPPRYIYFLDSKEWCKNIFQITHQVTINGVETNRYDVTVLINGLPLVQIELKKRGEPISKAFKQINRYQNHSFNTNYGLFGFVQIFIISNGANTKYYANNKALNYKQTFKWADIDNNWITDIVDFSGVFLEKCHLAKMICKYIVLTTQKQLMILRPYQFYGVEKIIQRVNGSDKNGYIWHTTGSGKTLTSFKASQLLTELDKVKKVVFVVDRRDLDTQTQKEFNKYKKDSVDSTDNTKQLVAQLKDETSLVVTTIQKLNFAISRDKNKQQIKHLENEKIVFVFDECHRSQFGTTHTKITKFFKQGQMIGFTGTPILDENAPQDKQTTAQLFDEPLHTYLINDALADENVLGFVVDYLPTKAVSEREEILRNLKPAEVKDDKDKKAKKKAKQEFEAKKAKIINQIGVILRSSERINENVAYIVDKHNTYSKNKTFTAMMCVESIEVLIAYYEAFKSKQSDLKIATIFSYSSNKKDDNDSAKKIDDRDIDLWKKEKLSEYINDYNQMFDCAYSVNDNDEYIRYSRNIAKRVKSQEIDLLLVVNMFLTGFDSPPLNTLYVDKYLKNHGLLQAFSRTNRTYAGKYAGNIVCFRDLKVELDKAITLFSNKNSKADLVRKTYEEYLTDFQLFLGILREVAETPSAVNELKTDEEKLNFTKVFKNILRLIDVMKTYVDFDYKDLQITEQEVNNYTSKYLDMFDNGGGDGEDGDTEDIFVDFDPELELLQTDIIDLQYVLVLLASKTSTEQEKDSIWNKINAIPKLRKQKDLIEDFIKQYEESNNKNIVDEFDVYKEVLKNEKIKILCSDYGLYVDKINTIISDYLYNKKEIKTEPVRDAFIKRLDLLRQSKLEKKVLKEIVAIIDKFY